MTINTWITRAFWVNIGKIIILLIITSFLFFMYNNYENSYSNFILYKANDYGEFKPLINFKDYDKVKLKKLFAEYDIEYKEQEGIYLIKNKDLQFEDLMYTISDQYFREKKSFHK